MIACAIVRLSYRFDVGRVTQSPLGHARALSHALLSCSIVSVNAVCCSYPAGTCMCCWYTLHFRTPLCTYKTRGAPAKLTPGHTARDFTPAGVVRRSIAMSKDAAGAAERASQPAQRDPYPSPDQRPTSYYGGVGTASRGLQGARGLATGS